MAASPSEFIQVGMACRTINPPTGLPLAGFPSPRPNTGGGLDLCVRVAAFAESGAETPDAAIIVLDNLGADADIVAMIRRAAAGAVAGLDGRAVMVCATHTHSAPGLRRYGGAKPGKAPTVDPTYIQQIITTAAATAADAWANRTPARMRVGGGAAELHHNRRVIGADGKADNVWLDLEGEHTGYTNPAAPFVVFEHADTGAVVGMIVSYGCHPVTLGPGSAKTSPDYPGYFVRRLEAATGAAVAIHITGAGGDINPRNCLSDQPAQAQWMGETLAEAVLAEMAGATVCPAAPIRTASKALHLRLGPDARENFSNRATDAGDAKTLTSEVQAVRLGDWMLVGAPGELFSQIGRTMEEASPLPHVMVAAYSNDYLGYLFTDAALVEGGYEPSNAISENIEKPLIAAAVEAMAATTA